VSQKSSALSVLFEWGENPRSFGPTDIVAKHHNLFVNIKKGWKKGGKKRNDHAHPLTMQVYNTREGGVAVICSNMTVCETHKPFWKRKLTYCDLNPGNIAEIHWCLVANSLITSEDCLTIRNPSHPSLPATPRTSSFHFICPLLIIFPLFNGTQPCRGVS
jgi:hypothetical protein